MVLIIMVFLLILGIAFWQLHQGVFSALIMLILSIMAALVAFNFYEPVGDYFFKGAFGGERHPMYIYATTLVAMFTVTLLVLRYLFDWLLSANVVFDMWPNRIGAGILGLMVGMVLTGVLAVAIQMLPVSETYLTYSSHKDDLSSDTGLVPFYPDSFVVGLVRTLSEGSLAGDTKWSQKHPDLLKEAFARRNTSGLPGRVDAKADALLSVSVFKPATWSFPEQSPEDPNIKNGQYYIVRADVSNQAVDPEDNWYRMVGTHFMMTAQKDDGTLQQYYPVAFLVVAGNDFVPVTMLKEGQKNALPAKLVIERDSTKPAGNNKISTTWVYLLPQDAKPREIVFRGVSTKPITKITEGRPSTAGALQQAK